MKYTIDDFKQSTIGAFVAIIVFFAIRGGNPFFFNAKIGIAITGVLAWIYYNGFKMQGKNLHFIINGLISFVVCSTMAITFGLATLEQIITFNVFGSLVIVGTWVAFPVAMIFDRYNFVNPMNRYYVRGKGK